MVLVAGDIVKIDSCFKYEYKLLSSTYFFEGKYSGFGAMAHIGSIS